MNKKNLNFFIKKKFYILIFFLIFIFFLFNIKKIDNKYFHENIKDFFGNYLYREVWSDFNSEVLNYKWINDYSLIVHGLEVIAPINSCNINNNTYDYNLFELNFISENNLLYVINNNKKCNKEIVLEIIKDRKFVIVDIKKNFDESFDLILNFAVENNFLDKIIFQLYGPDNLVKFFNVYKKFDNLPGPIITSYKSRRSINYLSEISLLNRIKVITIPISKSEVFSKVDNLNYFTHSVHSCDTYYYVRKNKKISGIYMDPNLQCLKQN